MSMKSKMHTTELYLPNDDSIMQEQILCMEKLYDYNMTRPLEQEKRAALREINEHDREYYFKDHKIKPEDFDM